MATKVAEEFSIGTVSSNPDDFASGLRDDFEAVIGGSKYVLRRGTNNPKHMLFGEVMFLIDGSEEYPERYLAGFLPGRDTETGKLLPGHCPSPDGRRLAGPDDVTVSDYIELGVGIDEDGEEVTIEEGTEDLYTGPYAVCVNAPGRPTKPLPPSGWGQFLESFKVRYKEQYGEDFPFSERADSIVGYTVHVNRLDQDPKLRRKAKDGAEQRTYQVLCVTDIISKPKASGTKVSKPTVTKSTTKPAAKPPADDDIELVDDENGAEENGFASELELSVVRVLKALAKVGKLPAKLPTITPSVLNLFKGDANKMSEATKLLNLSAKWINSDERPWVWDAESKTFTIDLEDD